MTRLENIAVNSAIAILGGAALLLKGIEAVDAWRRWKLHGETLD